ncbi:hypothetical protein FGO68_gene6987 [Halteria grandinella]|uniref:Secreted protein n=1 Tax=Halteria grandinella TaxID=5974 RepID=A0A8J8NFK4_HALGN|nr:hypothetical protein FGO68_gene6987 [Halteria grandinella]
MMMRRMWLTAWPCLVTDFTSTQLKSNNRFYPCLVNVNQPKWRYTSAIISPNYSQTCLFQSMIQHQNVGKNPLKVNVPIILEDLGS